MFNIAVYKVVAHKLIMIAIVVRSKTGTCVEIRVFADVIF